MAVSKIGQFRLPKLPELTQTVIGLEEQTAFSSLLWAMNVAIFVRRAWCKLSMALQGEHAH